jgi:hypothetical protein
VCIRPTHIPKAIYCRPLLMRSGMQASNCQHIKSLCAFARGSLALPRQSGAGRRVCPKSAAILLLPTGASGPKFPSSSFSHVSHSAALICPRCFLHLYLGSFGPNLPSVAAPIPPPQLISHTPRHQLYSSLATLCSPDSKTFQTCSNAALELTMADACRVSQAPVQSPAYHIYGQSSR